MPFTFGLIPQRIRLRRGAPITASDDGLDLLAGAFRNNLAGLVGLPIDPASSALRVHALRFAFESGHKEALDDAAQLCDGEIESDSWVARAAIDRLNHHDADHRGGRHAGAQKTKDAAEELNATLTLYFLMREHAAPRRLGERLIARALGKFATKTVRAQYARCCDRLTSDPSRYHRTLTSLELVALLTTSELRRRTADDGFPALFDPLPTLAILRRTTIDLLELFCAASESTPPNVGRLQLASARAALLPMAIAARARRAQRERIAHFLDGRVGLTQAREETARLGELASLTDALLGNLLDVVAADVLSVADVHEIFRLSTETNLT